jgi:tetratricopeptide (TPR) repeat protein
VTDAPSTATSKRLDVIEKMIAAGSKDPFHWYARAMELRSLSRLEESLPAYDACIEKFPNYVPTYLMAGQVASELGRKDDARRYMEEGLQMARAAGDDHALSELQSALGLL